MHRKDLLETEFSTSDEQIISELENNLDKSLLNNKDYITNEISKTPYAFVYASDELKNDKEVVTLAVSKLGIIVKYASEKLRKDKEIALLAINNDVEAYNYIDYDLKNNKEIIDAMINKDKTSIQYIYDRDIVIELLSQDNSLFEYINYTFSQDDDIIQKYGPINYDHYGRDYTGHYLNKKEQAFYNVSNWSTDYDTLDLSLQNDKEIAKAAIDSVSVYHIYDSEFRMIHKIVAKFNDDKIIALKALEKAPKCYFKLSDELKKDRDIAIATINSFNSSSASAIKAYENIFENFKKDKEIVVKIINLYGLIYYELNDSLQKDRDIVYAMLNNSESNYDIDLNEIFDIFYNDKEIVLLVIKEAMDRYDNRNSVEMIKRCLQIYNYDKEISIMILKGYKNYHLEYPIEVEKDYEEKEIDRIYTNYSNYYVSNCNYYNNDTGELYSTSWAEEKELNDENVKIAISIVKKYSKDKDVIIEAVKSTPQLIKYVDESLKKDKDIILEVAKNSKELLRYIDESYKTDKDVLLEVILKETYYDQIYNDRLMELLKNDKLFINYFNGSTEKYYDLIIEALKINTCIYFSLDASLRRDKKIIFEILKYDLRLYRNLDIEIRNDREVVLYALSQLRYGRWNLQGYVENLSPSLKRDKEIAMLLVEICPWTIEEIDPILKGDRDIVLAAVSQDGSIISVVDYILKKDKEIVLAAINTSSIEEVYRFLPREMKFDPEINRIYINLSKKRVLY